MRRGTVLLAGLDPAFHGETATTRPLVVVSNIGANRAALRLGRGTLVVVPLTTSLSSVHPDAHVVVDDDGALEHMGLASASTIQAEQVRAISVQRVQRELGTTPAWVMHQLDEALRFHLSL